MEQCGVLVELHGSSFGCGANGFFQYRAATQDCECVLDACAARTFNTTWNIYQVGQQGRCAAGCTSHATIATEVDAAGATLAPDVKVRFAPARRACIVRL